MDRRTFLKTVAEAAGIAGVASFAETAWALEKVEAVPSGSLTLAAVGDCILARRPAAGQDPDVQALVDLLRSADGVWGNYELVQADPREVDPRAVLASWPAELRSLGLRLVGTAYNHTLDYGEEG